MTDLGSSCVRAMAAHLAEAIHRKTVSFEDPSKLDAAAFEGLHAFLRTAYPRIHDTLHLDEVGRFSLLYTWRGSDPTLGPVLLLAHQDVVPAEDEGGWRYPPFAGTIADGAVWGRGAIDVKGSLVAICEAVEALIGEGFRPRRTILLAFGHDEEVGGEQGAAKISDLLQSRGVHPLLICDEGGAITHDIVPGAAKPVALVGIAEKGYLSLELKVQQPGGHASMPPARTAIGILCAAIDRLERRPFPARVAGVPRLMLRHLAPHMPPAARLAVHSMPVFERLVRRQLLKQPSSAAMLRTTTAATIFRAGVKDNLLPQEATAVINLRILPGETTQSTIDRVRKVVADDRVQLSTAGRLRTEPSPVADIRSPGFELMRQTIAQIAPDAAIAPCLVLGGTDSRHYTRLTPNIFRFGAMRITQDDLATIHGNNERLTFENCELLMRFYTALLNNADGLAR
ncbi:MAG TPA: M20 family peptidase [Tepidisphaeraceae bacterium]|jgi:carboxypeptidase PM20D1